MDKIREKSQNILPFGFSGGYSSTWRRLVWSYDNKIIHLLVNRVYLADTGIMVSIFINTKIIKKYPRLLREKTDPTNHGINTPHWDNGGNWKLRDGR